MMDINKIKKKFNISSKGIPNFSQKRKKVRVNFINQSRFTINTSCNRVHLKNAPISRQKQWKKMSIPQKIVKKSLFPDFDRDGVPNRWDCRPKNPFKQDSQIYLDPTKVRIPKKKKHMESRIKSSIFREHTSGTGGYVMPAVFPKKIFFGSGFRKVDFRKPENIKYLAKVIEHEETHHALHNIDKKRESPDEISDSSKAFDDIVIPSVKKSQFTEGKPEEWGEIINPHSALEIEPEAAKELGLSSYEEDKPIFKTYEQIYKYEQERENPSIVYLEDEGASVEKQEEWKEKTEMEKDVERITEPDTDGDLVPDEYDCEPENPEKQDIVFSRKPNKMSKDAWEKQKRILTETTRKESMGLDPKIKMNTILNYDKSLKRIKQVNPVWQDDEWHRKYNQAAIEALKRQGYNQDDATEFLAEKERKKAEAANFFAQELSKDKKLGKYFDKPDNEISDEEGRKRYKEYQESEGAIAGIGIVEDIEKQDRPFVGSTEEVQKYEKEMTDQQEGIPSDEEMKELTQQGIMEAMQEEEEYYETHCEECGKEKENYDADLCYDCARKAAEEAGEEYSEEDYYSGK